MKNIKQIRKEAQAFVDNFKNIKWFKPSQDLTKDFIRDLSKNVVKKWNIKDKKIDIILLKGRADIDMLEAMELTKEYGELFNSTKDSLNKRIEEAGLKEELDVIWQASKAEADKAIRENIFFSTWHGAWIAGLTALEILAEEEEGYFKALYNLYAIGCYPVGVNKKTKKFTVVVPPSTYKYINQ